MNRIWTYRVMHKDLCVARISQNGQSFVFSPAFMPYSLYLEPGDDLDTRINNLTCFYSWCASRLLTLDRVYAKEILNSLSCRQAVTDQDRAKIAIQYHGLSLTDVFWIQSAAEDLRYSDISLYSHSLSDAFVDVSLRGKQMTAQNAMLLDYRDAAGDLSTSGVAPKAWRRENGSFFLYKDGNPRDVRAELRAGRVLDCFDIPHVSYKSGMFDGQPVSISRLITSESMSIVPMEAVEIYAVNHDRKPLDLVLEKDPEGFYAMNIADYLVGNTDRHWGNWGFFVDNADNQLRKLHPLMDFNKAFLHYDDPDGALCLTLPGHVSQREAAIEAVRQIGLRQTGAVDPEWFESLEQAEMFRTRLHCLKSC